MGAKCVVVHEACGYFEEDKNREAVMVAFKAQKRLGWFPKVRTLGCAVIGASVDNKRLTRRVVTSREEVKLLMKDLVVAANLI